MACPNTACNMSSFKYVCLVRFPFFFQAEDGIRDLYVTGVQTCALPISVQDAAARFLHICGSDFYYESFAALCERLEIGRASCRERVGILERGPGVKPKRDGQRAEEEMGVRSDVG